MARGNYAPEIRSSIGDSPKGRINTSPRKASPRGADSPAEVARDTKAGITQNSPADIEQDAMPRRMPPMQMQGGGPDPHSVGAATSIAHAILQHKGGGAY